MSLPPSSEYLAEDISQRVVDVAIAFMVIMTVVYILFNYSRLCLVKQRHWELWAIYPISYLSCIGLCIIAFLGVEIGGAGRHTVYWVFENYSVIIVTLKLRTATTFMYMVAVTVTKLPILILYLRVFTGRKSRIATWVVLAMVILYMIGYGIIYYFVICIPFEYKWDKTIPGGRCGDLMAAYRYASIPNIIIDLAVLVLPVPTLWNLQITKMQKVGIFFTFLLGSLGIATAIVRFDMFLRVDLDDDMMYLAVDFQTYTVIECSAYFLCSCFPHMRPLAVQIYRVSGMETLMSRKDTAMNSSDISGLTSKRSENNIQAIGVARSHDGWKREADTDGFIQLREIA